MRLPAVIALCALAACNSPVESPATDDAAFDRLVTGGEQVFELSSTDGKPATPAVVFDHRCADVRYMHTLRDRVVLRADGTAERIFQFDRHADRRLLDSFQLRAVGTWSRLVGANDRYYGSGPSIVLALTPDDTKVPAYTMNMKVGSDRVLGTMSPVGGSCPGSPNDARHVEFSYTRR